MATLIERAIGAARLDVATYEEVEHDPSALGQAMTVVAAAALASGVGSAAQQGLGALGLKAGAKQSGVADLKQQAQREREVLDLAEKSNGDLTATETARALGVTIEEADRMLTEMADGSRIAVDVDTDGIVHYVFRELRAESDARARSSSGSRTFPGSRTAENSRRISPTASAVRSDCTLASQTKVPPRRRKPNDVRAP